MKTVNKFLLILTVIAVILFEGIEDILEYLVGSMIIAVLFMVIIVLILAVMIMLPHVEGLKDAFHEACRLFTWT